MFDGLGCIGEKKGPAGRWQRRMEVQDQWKYQFQFHTVSEHPTCHLSRFYFVGRQSVVFV